MRPTTASWNYYHKTHDPSNGFNSVTCALEQATSRIPYSLFYSPKLQNDYTIFIVHITQDVTGTMDVIATTLKTPEVPFTNEEYIQAGDYYASYVLPHSADIVGCTLSISVNNTDQKIFYFNNENIFIPGQFITWGVPAGVIDFSPHNDLHMSQIFE